MNYLSLAIAATLILVPRAQAQIVNIDFLAQGVNESPAPNFAGPGPIGTGTFYNGLTANDPAGVQTVVVTGTGLKDSNDNVTSVGVSFGPSGADNQGGGFPSSYGPVNGGYLFTSSSIAFTITGLGTATTENLYFTTSDFSDLGAIAPTFTTGGGTLVTYTATNGSTVFTNGTGVGSPAGFGQTAGNTYEYENVAVVGGNISGTLSEVGSGGTLILSAVTIASAPEPSTYAMILGGFAILGLIIRRKGALVG